MRQDLSSAGFDAGPIATPVLTPRTIDFNRNTQEDLRRLFFISYAFPPTGGGGVQRSVKFTKYLPEFGWRATVLTAANPSVPLQDRHLEGELHPSTNVLRARTLEPSYSVKQKLSDPGNRSTGTSIRGLLRKVGMHLLQPDPQVLWNPGAMRMAAAALRQTEHEVIYATGPPFSSFLLGRALKRRFGLPLILDFRDEWLLASQNLENYQLGPIAYRRQRAMMSKVLSAADAVITTTQASAKEIARYCHQASSRASVTCIYNGYDQDDLVRVRSDQPASSKLRLVYTGTLWKLTNVAPVVSALEYLASISKEAAGRIELVLAGRNTPAQVSKLGQLDATPVSVESHNYLPHRSSLELAASAHVLVLLLADEPGAERVVPAKLFEYIALGKPVLAICPSGEAAELLRQHRRAHIFPPTNTKQVANWLRARVQRQIIGPATVGGAITPLPSGPAIERFSRRELTAELASLLGSVVSRT